MPNFASVTVIVLNFTIVLAMASHNRETIQRSASNISYQGDNLDEVSGSYISDDESWQHDDYENSLAHPHSPDHHVETEMYTGDRRPLFYEPSPPLIPRPGEEVPEDFVADYYNLYDTHSKVHHAAGTFRYDQRHQLITPFRHNPRSYNELLRGRIMRYKRGYYRGNTKLFFEENSDERNFLEAMRFVSQDGPVHAVNKNHIYYNSTMTPQQLEAVMNDLPTLKYDRTSRSYVFDPRPPSSRQRVAPY